MNFNIILYYSPLSIIILILFFFGLLTLLFIMTLILLDLFYRPESAQYPFNLFLDRIIPIMLLIIPSIFSYGLLSPETSLLKRFVMVLLIHIFILIPIYHYWSVLRNWRPRNKNTLYFTIDSPLLYKEISIALLYPCIWGILLSCVRYIRLGSTLNIFDIFQNVPVNIVCLMLIIFLFYYKFLLFLVLYFRLRCWNALCNVMRPLHIYLLRYNMYFKFYEYLYRFCLIIHSYISSHPLIFPRKNLGKFKKLLQKLWMKPRLLNFFIFGIFLSEMLITRGNLYYSFYILFMYSIFYAFFYLTYVLYMSNIILESNRAEYFSRNWVNPRFPVHFWTFFEDDTDRYGFNWSFTESEKILISTYSSKYDHISDCIPPYRRTLPLRVQDKTYCTRLKAYYRSRGLRWTHTLISECYHKATGHFLRGFLPRTILVNSNHHHLPVILKAESEGRFTYWPKNFKLFNRPQDELISYSSLLQMLEQNLITNFVVLSKNNVRVSTFDSTLNIESKTQAKPDMVLDFRKNTKFLDNRIHGVDQKSVPRTIGRNIAFSNISVRSYKTKLDEYYDNLSNIHIDANTSQIFYVLQALKDSCEDFSDHQLIWASNLHLFPNGFLPPMRLPSNVNFEAFSPEVKALIPKALGLVKKTSDLLYAKKIPPTVKNGLTPEGLDFFEDSQLRELLSQDEFL